jgi:tetratricopeptide (TPR) repeat protein
MRFPSTLACVLLAFLAGACAASSVGVRENLQAGEEAFERGDVLTAYRLLRNPALTQETLPPRYSTLLKQVTEAAEYLIERWLEKGDFWLAQGNFSKANSYYRDIADQLPPHDPFRIKLVEKTRELDKKIEEVKSAVEELVEEGLEAFKSSDFKKAGQKLAEARWKAVEHNLPFTMRYQRLIEECKRRLPEETDQAVVAEGDNFLAPEKSVDRPPRKSRRRRALRRRKGPINTDDEEVYRGLLRQGMRYQTRKMYLEAILTYRKVLELYPEQPEAAQALERLESVRKQLLDEELRKAGEFFARENLEKAAPHYQRALLLDPGNIRAQEGLQMYQRLKELRKKQE